MKYYQIKFRNVPIRHRFIRLSALPFIRGKCIVQMWDRV